MNKLITGLATAGAFLLMASAVSAKVDRVPGPVEYGPWNVSGNWVFDYHYGDSINLHDMTLAQDENGALSGSGGAFSGSQPYQYPWTVATGSVSGNAFDLTANYNLLACSFTLTGTIKSDGTMGGTWTDNCFGARNGTWTTTSGVAKRESTQFTGNHGQFVSSQIDKQEAAQSDVGMPVQSEGHTD